MFIVDLQTDSPDGSPPNSGHENEDLLGNHDSSSGYHSSGEETANQQQHLSSLDLENKLLRQEVESLNQEMQSVIYRAQSANEGEYCVVLEAAAEEKKA